MTQARFSRRQVLKRLASLGAIGAMGSLRSFSLFANEQRGHPTGALPGVKGRVVHRYDDDYEAVRQSIVWHKSKPGRYPDVIVQARSEQDVINAVKFAAKNNLKVTTRSGGHKSTGVSLRDGGLLVDVFSLNDIQIDVNRKMASVQSGVKSAHLISVANEQGLAFPVPHCPSVALGGFLMGGGFGWNYAHRGGMSCFSVEAAEIVTGEGKLLMASADQNSDLLWAVRGAGPGFFGVVTRFHLKLYPMPTSILVSSYIHSLDNLEKVTKSLDKIMKTRDERVEVITLLMHNPEAPSDAPPESSKICMVTAFAFGNSDQETRSLLEPFSKSDLARNTLAKVETNPYTFAELYGKFFSQNVAAGMRARYAVDNVITDDPGGTLRALAEHFKQSTSVHNHVLAAYGTKMKARDDACFSSIGDTFVGCYAIWEDEKEDEMHFQWLDKTLPLIDPFANGHYVNEVESRRHPERIAKCFSKENWRRLQALRHKYDPNGVFHDYLGHG
ncbi:MAG: FAD-binding oxidoreductase [Candidatus Thiodiazotropha sp.]